MPSVSRHNTETQHHFEVSIYPKIIYTYFLASKFNDETLEAPDLQFDPNLNLILIFSELMRAF